MLWTSLESLKEKILGDILLSNRKDEWEGLKISMGFRRPMSNVKNYRLSSFDVIEHLFVTFFRLTQIISIPITIAAALLVDF